MVYCTAGDHLQNFILTTLFSDNSGALVICLLEINNAIQLLNKDSNTAFFFPIHLFFSDDVNRTLTMPIRNSNIVTVVALYQGCFRRNVTVVTIYASLGEEALCHSLNEVSLAYSL